MNERLTLQGLTCLVTGASRGIGRASALALSDRGAQVVGMARSRDALENLERECGARPLVVDLADDAGIWAAIDELAESELGSPDVVVNAAGVFGIESCSSTSVNSFDEHVRINLRAPFILTRAVLPKMLERKSGLVVNIGSIAGRKAFPGNGAYSASKYGLRGFHEVLLEEIRGTGVRASLIEPAATDTPLWDEINPDANPDLPNRVDMLTPDQVAQAVVFVATRPEGVSVPYLAVERG
jgi:NADP-dependent 3-hydroxy acid dehydrogenase YdfG